MLPLRVLPSRAEGFSNALLEYMALGRPIVATEVGGNSELPEDNAAGLIVAPENSDALAEAVIRLIRNVDLDQRLSAYAQCRVYQQYELETTITVYQEYCKQIVA